MNSLETLQNHLFHLIMFFLHLVASMYGFIPTGREEKCRKTRFANTFRWDGCLYYFIEETVIKSIKVNYNYVLNLCRTKHALTHRRRPHTFQHYLLGYLAEWCLIVQPVSGHDLAKHPGYILCIKSVQLPWLIDTARNFPSIQTS